MSPHLHPSRRQLSGLRATHHTEPTVCTASYKSRFPRRVTGRSWGMPDRPEPPPLLILQPGGQAGRGPSLWGRPLALVSWPKEKTPHPTMPICPSSPSPATTILSPNTWEAPCYSSLAKEGMGRNGSPRVPGGFMVIGNHTQFWNLPPPTATTACALCPRPWLPHGPT